MRSCFAVLRQRDLLTRGGPAHDPARTMAAAVEALRVAEPAHDVAARTHAAGNDAQLAGARTDCALAGDQQFLTAVRFLLHVVVVAVHRQLFQLELRQAVAHFRQHPRHHRLAVFAGVILRPRHRFHVLIEQRLVLHEECEVLVGQMKAQHAVGQLLTRPLDEIGADQVAGAARAAVQHHPDRIGFVQADLDEVIAAAQRADLALQLVGTDAPMGLLDRFQARHQPGLCNARGDAVRKLTVFATTAIAHRHAALDAGAQLGQVVGQIVGTQRGAHCGHATADVHPDRGRDDGAAGRDHRAHGCTLAQVHVGHHRHPRPNKGHGGDVAQLCMRLFFQRHAAHPALDRRGGAFGMQKFIGVCVHCSHSFGAVRGGSVHRTRRSSAQRHQLLQHAIQAAEHGQRVDLFGDLFQGLQFLQPHQHAAFLDQLCSVEQ